MAGLQTIVGERRTYPGVGCVHDHDYAQLIVPLIGCLAIETPAHQLTLDESAVFFLPPHCTHYFYGCSTNEFLTLDIPAALMADLAQGEGLHGIYATFEERWRAVRSLLLAEIDDTANASALLALVQYIRSLLAQRPQGRSLDYLHRHYHEPLNVAHLAQIEGYSLTYYSEWFKAKTGTTPKAYLQHLRLQRAKELLQHTDLPIAHIAHAVGFEQPSSLTRLFQQRDRTTPRRYRAHCRNVAKS